MSQRNAIAIIIADKFRFKPDRNKCKRWSTFDIHTLRLGLNIIYLEWRQSFLLLLFYITQIYILIAMNCF